MYSTRGLAKKTRFRMQFSGTLPRLPVRYKIVTLKLRRLLRVQNEMELKYGYCHRHFKEHGGSDVYETRRILDAVSLSFALDFVAHRIESGAAGACDVVSIITVGDTSET